MDSSSSDGHFRIQIQNGFEKIFRGAKFEDCYSSVFILSKVFDGHSPGENVSMKESE